ncbi:MAG: lysophospholipid acyltransferase family protein [Akkermansiaceae bacterium]|nr:lysophospholipid acyltransferase family protein [Akkermansiaceae bacterium]
MNYRGCKRRVAPELTEPAPRNLANSEKNTEIRGGRKEEILGTLVGWLMRGWAKTLRVQIDDRCGVTLPNSQLPPVIYAMWHNRIFTIPPIWARTSGRFRRAAVLTSASKDGTILARAMEVFQLQSVRGSSSRRAVAALIGMRRTLKEGIDICITPDGPRGPKYSFHPGIIKLAESSRAPIVAVHAAYSSAWRLKTWDMLVIPKPFSKVTVIFDEILVIPSKLDDAAFVTQLENVKSILLTGVDDA